MSVVRFYLDEDCQSAALATALRGHGIDATTTHEVGNAGVDDDTQMQHATDAGRVVVSNNIGDFSALHARWLTTGRDHTGIILFPQQQYSIGEIVRVCCVSGIPPRQKRCATDWNGSAIGGDRRCVSGGPSQFAEQHSALQCATVQMPSP